MNTTQGFSYIKPARLNELKTILASDQPFRLLAGGTDLMIQKRHQTLTPCLMVDIKGIKEFSKITVSDKSIFIGSTVTLNEIAEHPQIKKHFPALSSGAGRIGSYQIRNRGTLVGNICNASPCADTTPGLCIYNAKVRIVTPEGKKTVPITKFFAGVKRTVLTSNQCVEGIILPIEANTKSMYKNFARRAAVDLSTVSVAAGIFNQDQEHPEVRICVGACSPIIGRATEAEKYLKKHGINPCSLLEAVKLLPISPIDDLRGSKEMRLTLARTLTIQILEELSGGQA